MISYFAYGSNLWIDQMVARTGPFSIGYPTPGIARLPGYRFAFSMQCENGQVYANIERPGEFVLGVIYSCTPEAIEKLDAFEGGYHRQEVSVINTAGATVKAVTYMADVKSTCGDGRPSAEYVQRILRGGRQHGLPEDYLRKIESGAA